MDSARTVLVPMDFSEASVAAFRCALSLHGAPGTTIVALHVLDPACVDFVVELGYAMPAEVAAKAKTHAEQRLGRLTGIEIPEGVEVQRVVVHGPPLAEILKLARELAADLVVLGVAALVGALAEAVVRGAPCPVLVIHGAGEEALSPPEPSQTDAPSGAPSAL